MAEFSRLFLVQVPFGLVLTLLVGLAALGLGLAWFLAAWRLAGHVFGRVGIDPSFRFWLRVFALVCYATLALALLLLAQLAVAWPALLERVGNVIGPAIAVTTVMAFVVKSTLLSVLLYGHHRVSPRRYSVCALGTALGFTLLVAGLASVDGWFRQPEGATLIDGRYQVFDWLAVAFTPQARLEFVLVLWGAVLAVSGVVLAVSAHQARLESDDGISRGLMAVVLMVGLVAVSLAWPMMDLVVRASFPQWMGWKVAIEGKGAGPAGLSVLLRAWAVFSVALFASLLFGLTRWSGPATGVPRIGRTDAGWLTLASIGGLGVWLTLWWVLQLGRGPYLVANQLPAVDLVSAQPTWVLGAGAALTGVLTLLIVLGLVRLVLSVSVHGVMPVHRSKVLP